MYSSKSTWLGEKNCNRRWREASCHLLATAVDTDFFYAGIQALEPWRYKFFIVNGDYVKICSVQSATNMPCKNRSQINFFALMRWLPIFLNSLVLHTKLIITLISLLLVYPFNFCTVFSHLPTVRQSSSLKIWLLLNVPFNFHTHAHTHARTRAHTHTRARAEQTIDHLLFQCELLGKERDKLIAGVAKTDNWPLSKSRLIHEHFRTFYKFIHEISLEKLNEM